MIQFCAVQIGLLQPVPPANLHLLQLFVQKTLKTDFLDSTILILAQKMKHVKWEFKKLLPGRPAWPIHGLHLE